jgi:hypothetical protein
MKLPDGGTYLCMVCGKPRGGRAGGKHLHDECYRVTQAANAEKNKKLAPRLEKAKRRTARAYLAGKLPGIIE